MVFSPVPPLPVNPAAPRGRVAELSHELAEGHPGPPLGGRGLSLDVLHVGGEHADLRGVGGKREDGDSDGDGDGEGDGDSEGEGDGPSLTMTVTVTNLKVRGACGREDVVRVPVHGGDGAPDGPLDVLGHPPGQWARRATELCCTALHLLATVLYCTALHCSALM